MKKLALAIAILTTSPLWLHAGPEPLPAKEMKQVAPMPPACPNWSGFYVGAFGGYKFAATDLDLTLNGSWSGPIAGDIADAAFIGSRVPDDLDTSGAEVGGLIGYNFQWSNWVVGLEATGGYLWLRDSDNTGTFTVPATGDEYNVETSLKTHYLVTVAPRIGYAFCRWLPYVTGGLAIGDIDYHQEINQFDQFLGGRHFFQEGGSTSETNLGWMVGGGLEYALTDHWRLRAQYQYIDLGCVDFDSAGKSPLVPLVAPNYTGNHEACLREHNASVALMFRF